MSSFTNSFAWRRRSSWNSATAWSLGPPTSGPRRASSAAESCSPSAAERGCGHLRVGIALGDLAVVGDGGLEAAAAGHDLGGAVGGRRAQLGIVRFLDDR